MRGKISDQDLTDYALNELPPEERLYIESMLAVSEECRNDIYEMIEFGQLLEEGFEGEETQAQVVWLTGEQRRKLVNHRGGPVVWQRAAGIVALAACAAFALTHASFWQMRNASRDSGFFASQVSVTDAGGAPTQVAFTTPLASFAAFADDASRRLPAAAADAIDTTVCTPPSWMENVQLTSVSETIP